MDTNKTLTHLTGENIQFIEQLYAQYKQDPASVDASWLPVFEELFEGDDPAGPPSPSFSPRTIFRSGGSTGGAGAPTGEELASFEDKLDGTQVHTPGKTRGFAASVESLVRAYRLHGHARAKLDPLGHPRSTSLPELHPETYGLTEADMDAPIRYEALFNGDQTTLRALIERLRDLYCGHIGVEYQYISEPITRTWLRKAIERRNYASITDDERRDIYQGLVDADGFETFLQKKYGSVKRFSLSGGDSLIPMMRAMFDEAGSLGVREILVGMAHRGRLNVLHNIMGKEDVMMFSEFEKTQTPEAYIGSSDVKYHMGYSSEYPIGDESIHLSMAFNPSHLEFVNPVVVGRARAKQDRIESDDARQRIMPFLLHGDAAFSGQGVVPETFNLSQLDGYHVGGTIHVVINNQVGFTTSKQEDARSTEYCTDVAKMIQAPILHVNADDPEAVMFVTQMAMDYRHEFKNDVVIDLVCYRRRGHNEADEPAATQPVMYEKIRKLTTTRNLYAEKLVADGVIGEEEAKQIELDYRDELDKGDHVVKSLVKEPNKDLYVDWTPYLGHEWTAKCKSSVALKTIQKLGKKLTHVPEGFSVQRQVSKIVSDREKMTAGALPINWGYGEVMAYATLLNEGHPIRITGQDVGRGTFSHRHAVLHNQKDGAHHIALEHISENQPKFEIYDSLLSEEAVMAFEYGYSTTAPNGLVVWEAQFGDFANGAQVVIDQFLTSGEHKWGRLCGLTLLLPHGYEGQGPEHSSARLERFLQLSAEHNIQVCVPTTPSQVFHMLRRQVKRPLRKPLVAITPKSLLRHCLLYTS